MLCGYFHSHPICLNSILEYIGSSKADHFSLIAFGHEMRRLMIKLYWFLGVSRPRIIQTFSYPGMCLPSPDPTSTSASSDRTKLKNHLLPRGRRQHQPHCHREDLKSGRQEDPRFAGLHHLPFRWRNIRHLRSKSTIDCKIG